MLRSRSFFHMPCWARTILSLMFLTLVLRLALPGGLGQINLGKKRDSQAKRIPPD